MFRIYNDWLVDFCRHYPDRHIGLACLPYGDIDAAVKEVHRVAKIGLRGLELSCSWDMEPMWHPVWEPLWQAVNEVNLPLHFHTFPSMPPGVREKATGLTRRAAMFTGVSALPDEPRQHPRRRHRRRRARALSRTCASRFGESGIGWIPYALDRMDFEWEDRFRDLGLTMKPSDYWRRQCKATFQFDRIGTKLIDEMGVETLMWASDYPHTDGVWPESSKYIAEQFGHLPRRRGQEDHLRERGEVLRADQLVPAHRGRRVRPATAHYCTPSSRRICSRSNPGARQRADDQRHVLLGEVLGARARAA